MTMTEEDRALQKHRLTEAEDALHRLNLGQNEVRMRDRSGRELEFKPANKRGLQDYINSLRKELGLPTKSGRGSRAISF
ncbi:gpW family head-tail joining protein [Pseudovibrio sp. Tun.PSC04-5.I4]|uniref:gpW family head-tail joining protein n=1 Tax=Pseudovibrio sp. Tun.PSC04-5.I4 TaxID=1798213 RepID=UPI0008869BB5|nr:gpW family head-tail joining protein [Pseudovibrio sp. Tun.PSC04-5.I4]SDQ99546.1 gpW protein [Pseudovibrio sp. Tun.PSC04-5.I4]